MKKLRNVLILLNYPTVKNVSEEAESASTFLTKGEMPMTMIRLNLVKGLGPVLQIAEGYAVNVMMTVYLLLSIRELTLLGLLLGLLLYLLEKTLSKMFIL